MERFTLNTLTVDRILARFEITKKGFESQFPGYELADPATGAVLARGFDHKESALAFAAAQLGFEDLRNTTERRTFFGTGGYLALQWRFDVLHGPVFTFGSKGSYHNAFHIFTPAEASTLLGALKQNRTRLISCEANTMQLRITHDTATGAACIETKSPNKGEIAITLGSEHAVPICQVIESGIARARDEQMFGSASGPSRKHTPLTI